MVRVGLIGYGKLGSIHAESIFSSSIGELVAVCDNNNEKLAAAKTKYNVNTYTDINEFLSSDIDAVVIATSTPMHLSNISLTAEAGKAIFTEKPVGLTLEETDEVLSKVVRSGIKFQIGFQRRWDPDFLAMKQVVDSGRLGKPILFKAYGRDPNASNPENWGLDKNGGLFLNAAIHDYDAARFVFGSEVVKVSATGATLVHHELNGYGDIDICNTTLFMENGGMAITEWSRFASYGYDVAAELICEGGRIEIGSFRNKGMSVQLSNPEADSVYSVFQNAYFNQLNAFLKSLQEDTIISPGVEDARAALHIALSARESFLSQSFIDIKKLRPLTKN